LSFHKVLISGEGLQELLVSLLYEGWLESIVLLLLESRGLVGFHLDLFVTHFLLDLLSHLLLVGSFGCIFLGLNPLFLCNLFFLNLSSFDFGLLLLFQQASFLVSLDFGLFLSSNLLLFSLLLSLNLQELQLVFLLLKLLFILRLLLF